MPMIDRTKQLRLRRNVKMRQRRITSRVQDADDYFSRELISRFNRIARVRRFAAGWLFVAVVFMVLASLQTVALSPLYQQERPARGGTYSEGIVGTFSNANPIYATGAVDVAVSKLVFAGLFTYDEKNELSGLLAESYTVDESGRTYTVKLKDGLRWHDGKTITADDVVYTIALIQNPETKSPLQSSWQGIAAQSVGTRTVIFNLPNAFSAFPHSLSVGILPKHIVSKIPPAELRASNFNTLRPVGSGPFIWAGLQLTGTGRATAIIALNANEQFVLGEPLIRKFILQTYEKVDNLEADLSDREVVAAAGIKNVEKPLLDNEFLYNYSFPTTAQTMVFLKMSSGVLSSKEVRTALAYATYRRDIINRLNQDVIVSRSVFLPSSFAYDKTVLQPLRDIPKANQILQDAGWVLAKDNIRVKDGVRLSFRLYAEDTKDNQIILKRLQVHWKEIGVEMIPMFQQSMDLQTIIDLHNFDALLNSISIGPDPDVFAYWHSTQADVRSATRLNFSEYKSGVADTALEAGRTRPDVMNRQLKYKPFNTAWVADVPAIALYLPHINYVTYGKIAGLQERTLNTDADRYNNVHQWSVATEWSTIVAPN